MSAKRLEKETYERKIQEETAIKQRAKTAMRQKVELHEAYQLLLQEHHVRVKRRARQKLLAIGLMKNSTMMSTNIEQSMTQNKNGFYHPESNGLTSIANPENQMGKIAFLRIKTWFRNKNFSTCWRRLRYKILYITFQW